MGQASRRQGQAEEERFKRLLDVGSMVFSELDLEAVLRSVLEAARDLTGAEFAALGVLDRDRKELERFLYLGIDEEARRAIGALPRGRGVLGELLRSPTHMRLRDVGEHPRAHGFPAGHPPMRSFLGVPIAIRGEAFGSLYMAEKRDAGEFDEADEDAARTLAAWAGVAIENARLYEGLDQRRTELEKALRGLEASSDISRTVASGIELDDLLELIVKRGRGVVGANQAMVLLSNDSELEIAAAAGEQPADLVGLRLGDAETWLNDLQAEYPRLRGLPTLISDLEFRDRPRGLLVALGGAGDEFDRNDEQVFESFAASAATTIVTVHAVEAEKLELSIEASERERRRWARELHDETLQELGALRVLLESQAGDEELGFDARKVAIEHVDRGIRNLQGLITELRPSVLDELGVGPAIESLAHRSSDRFGIAIDVDVDLSAGVDAGGRLPPDVEATVYRLVQEATNNAIKHADPSKISITVGRGDTLVEVVVADDGRGFDPESADRSFGLLGMEERVSLAGGRLEIDSAPGRGTEVHAEMPYMKERPSGRLTPRRASRSRRSASSPPPS